MFIKNPTHDLGIYLRTLIASGSRIFHNHFTSIVLLPILAFTLSGCSFAPKPSDYFQETPVLDLQTYFNGTVDGWGVIKNRSGRVTKRFTVVMKCSWTGTIGILDEDFTFSDGTTQKRVWTVVKNGDHYTGTAPDVRDLAVGRASGNALNWKYTLAIPWEGIEVGVNFDDWMYLTDSNNMISVAKMSKFGIDLGEVIINFRKREPSLSEAPSSLTNADQGILLKPAAFNPVLQAK